MFSVLVIALVLSGQPSNWIVIREPEPASDQRGDFSARCPFGSLIIKGKNNLGLPSMIYFNGKRVTGDAYAPFSEEMVSPVGLHNLGILCDTVKQMFVVDVLTAKYNGKETVFTGGRAYIGSKGVLSFSQHSLSENRFWTIIR